MLAIHLSTRCSRRIRHVDFGTSRQRLILVAPGEDGRRRGAASCSWSSSFCLIGTWAQQQCASSRILAAPLPASLRAGVVGARRGLAIRSSKRTIAARKQRAAAASKQKNKTQSNEQLVATIMAQQQQQQQQAGAVVSAAEVSVRVTPDPIELRGEQQHANGQQTTNKKPEPVVMSLQEAIQRAVAQDKDLVAIALNQEIPVVTISRLESLQYQAEKVNKERRNSKSQAASSILKEATFKVGIADYDLQRKVDDVCKFLQKGHNCRITIKAPRRYARQDPTSTRTMSERVVGLLEENGGEVVGEAVFNAEETQARFTVRPKKL